MQGIKVICKSFIFVFICLLNFPSINSQSIVYCGLDNPSVASDCYGYSNKTNSCCFFSFAGNNGCALLNTRYKGGTQYGGLIVSCFGEMIKFRMVYLYLLIITVFYIFD